MRIRLLIAVAFLAMIGLAAFEGQGGQEASPLIVPSPSVESAKGSPLAAPATAFSSPDPTPVVSVLFDGKSALGFAADQMSFGPRPTGSQANIAAGNYIISRLREYRWQVAEQPFDYLGTQARNIIATRGNGPTLIVGAHYDTRRRADRDQDDPTQPVPGANDGASGVAVLVELARVLDVEATGHRVQLIFFDAEDNGGLDGWDWIAGSTHAANSLYETPQMMVLVDMVGDADQQIYWESTSDVDLRARIWNTAAELGYEGFFLPQIRHSILDDHTPFLRKGIPAVDIIDFDYPYWHTTGDTLDKISTASLERVGRTLQVWLERGAP